MSCLSGAECSLIAQATPKQDVADLSARIHINLKTPKPRLLSTYTTMYELCGLFQEVFLQSLRFAHGCHLCRSMAIVNSSPSWILPSPRSHVGPKMTVCVCVCVCVCVFVVIASCAVETRPLDSL